MRRVASLLVGVALLAGCGGGGTTSHLPQFAKLRNGMTKAEVRALVGPPPRIVQIPFPSPGSLDEGFEECWNYGRLPVTPLWELCFWGGKRLTSHTKYG
jgi:hypothetical protein